MVNPKLHVHLVGQEDRDLYSDRAAIPEVETTSAQQRFNGESISCAVSGFLRFHFITGPANAIPG